MNYLQDLLKTHHIPFAPSDDFHHMSWIGFEGSFNLWTNDARLDSRSIMDIDTDNQESEPPAPSAPSVESHGSWTKGNFEVDRQAMSQDHVQPGNLPSSLKEQPRGTTPLPVTSNASSATVRPHPWSSIDSPSTGNVSRTILPLPWNPRGIQTYRGCEPCRLAGLICSLEGVPGDPPCRRCSLGGIGCFFDFYGGPATVRATTLPSIVVGYYGCTSCQRRGANCSLDVGPGNPPGNPPCVECERDGIDCFLVPAPKNFVFGPSNINAGNTTSRANSASRSTAEPSQPTQATQSKFL